MNDLCKKATDIFHEKGPSDAAYWLLMQRQALVLNQWEMCKLAQSLGLTPTGFILWPNMLTFRYERWLVSYDCTLCDADKLYHLARSIGFFLNEAEHFEANPCDEYLYCDDEGVTRAFAMALCLPKPLLLEKIDRGEHRLEILGYFNQSEERVSERLKEFGRELPETRYCPR